MALCVFDIHPDGSATIPTDEGLTGNGVYRWWHFDLADPDLVGWASAHLDPIPLAALMQSETRPRCDRYSEGLILNLRGVNMNDGQAADQMVSVRMWITADVIITVRVRKVFAIDDIRQSIVAGTTPGTIARFLDTLILRLTDRVQDEVMEIAAMTDTCEDEIAEDVPPPSELGEIHRSVIKLRRYMEPQRAALQKLAGTDLPFVTENDRLNLRELANRSTLAVEELDALRDRLASVQDHFDTQVSMRQGRNGYALSVVAAVFLPLGFFTGLFGVNVGGMPGIENPMAFAVLSLGMVVSAIAMILFMRWMRWL